MLVASIIEINQGDMSLFPIMFIVNGDNETNVVTSRNFESLTFQTLMIKRYVRKFIVLARLGLIGGQIINETMR